MTATKFSGKAADASVKLPYEAVLAKTVDKLTNEFLLFLIGYCILLIGAEYLTPHLFSRLKLLFYVLPVLGIVAYLYSKRSGLKQKLEVEVRALVADRARIIGITGDASDLQGSVDVKAGVATRGAEVIGVDQAGGKQASDEAYLLDVFRRLDNVGRTEVINAANGASTKRRR
jgi:hypothetical protein